MSINRKFSKEMVSSIISDLTYNNISLVGNYFNYCDFCDFKCKKCGLIFKKRPITLIFGLHHRSIKSNGCPKCIQKELNIWKLDYYETNYVREIKRMNSNIDVEVYDKRKSTYYCRSCKNKFKASTNNMLKNCVCPYCYIGDSTGEYIIRKILSYNDINFTKEYNFYNNYTDSHQRIDFVFHYKNNLHAIEYQGNQHYNVKNGLYTHDRCLKDKYKSLWCMNNSIVLHYIYDYEDIYFELCKIIKGLKMPNEKFMNLYSDLPNKIMLYLKNSHNLIETEKKFNVGNKYITRIIKAYGYKNYLDLYQKNRLKKLYLTNEKIIHWLWHHHFNKIEKELGITKKYVITRIFNNPKYPFKNITEIKEGAIKSKEFEKYRRNHSKRNTERYFLTDATTICKILKTNNW